MKDNNFLNLLAAFLTSSAVPNTSPKSEPALKENKTLLLVENIRRQLMKDNYDYMPEDTTNTIASDRSNPYHMEDLSGDRTNRRQTAMDILTGSDTEFTNDTIANRKSKLGQAHSEYLSNMDNRNKMVAASNRRSMSNSETSNEYEVKTDDKRPSPKEGIIKYSLLKVKGPSRRSDSHPQLLQEEKENEVSIVNLGGGPVPSLRLPHQYRQFMNQHDSDFSYSSDSAKGTLALEP